MKTRSVHDLYPVRTVARLTGLTPDLIRAWEKRYDVVSPMRGARGARLYTAEDVEHLRLLATLVAQGRAIGDVAGLARERLQALTGTATTADAVKWSGKAGTAGTVESILQTASRFDIGALERQLGEALLALGGAAFVRRVAAPLLQEVGERWEAGKLSIGSEHLISAALRNLLGGLIRGRGNAAAAGILLAAPSGEQHEFGLLLTGFVAAEAGLRVCMLGAETPAAEIVSSALRGRIDAVGLSLVNSDNRTNAGKQIKEIDKALPANVELWLGGRDASATLRKASRTRALLLTKPADVERHVHRLVERSPLHP
jgi:DNA-binding transcriptional MerR regulator/methylmalonyl-CoA mutase cobalamin-binding subunit